MLIGADKIASGFEAFGTMIRNTPRSISHSGIPSAMSKDELVLISPTEPF